MRQRMIRKMWNLNISVQRFSDLWNNAVIFVLLLSIRDQAFIHAEEDADILLSPPSDNISSILCCCKRWKDIPPSPLPSRIEYNRIE